jgi:hypothetical protein
VAFFIVAFLVKVVKTNSSREGEKKEEATMGKAKHSKVR